MGGRDCYGPACSNWRHAVGVTLPIIGESNKKKNKAVENGWLLQTYSMVTLAGCEFLEKQTNKQHDGT